MVINDIHIPFNDSKLLSVDGKGLILDIIEDRKLDRLIINGDLADLYAVNMHGPKHPGIQETLEDELIAVRDCLHNIRKRFPNLEIVYVFGNHETRLNRFILKNSKVFWNLLTLEKYFRLDELNIEYRPYNSKYQIEDTTCFVQHSPPSYGVNGARTSLLKKLNETYIYGCTHREQKSCATAGDGQVFAAYFNGWLGSIDETPGHEEVFSYVKGHSDWQQAFTIVTVVERKEFHINQYSIRDHKVVVDGYLFKG